MIPENINKEHIDKAIQEIDKEGIRQGRHSNTYDLVHNGKNYPPKLVLSIANRFANDIELNPNDFEGGEGTPAFQLLKKEGFKIVEKNNSNNYKVINEFVSKIKTGEINSADSITNLISSNSFEERLSQVDKMFFENRLQGISAENHTETIGFIKEIHAINGVYNDFNIWSAAKNHLLKNNPELIPQHDALNKKLGFADNQNGIYKSFLGEKNLITFINKKFNNSDSAKKYWIYAPGKNATKWDEFYNSSIMALGWDEIGDLKQYKTRTEIKISLLNAYGGEGSRMNDVSANDDFINKVNIGDVIIAKKGLSELIGYGVVTSDYFFDTSRIDYQSCRGVDWKLKGKWKVDHRLVLKTFTDITRYPSDRPEYDTYYNQLLGMMTNTTFEISSITIQSLNTILYGPPGTGKTHVLKNKYMDMFTSTENTITREEFLIDLIQNCSWWQVIALAVLDISKTKVADIFRHEFVQIKANLSNSTTVTPTIWGQLQAHTIEDCENVKVQRRMPPLIFNKTDKSEWEILEAELAEQAPEILELKSKIDGFDELPKKRIERFEFLTFHQSYSYEDFIEGIKPELSDSEVAYKIETGVFQKMCNRARNDSANDYAIFIDEINRGNISSIFGELITLIEDDKREGRKNEIKATLPYSKQPFSVPSNLYIIGTMNTADRSVEALDTALRRRFSFVEMNPEPNKLNELNFRCEGVDLAKMLTAMNGRIEKLLDKDYCIGHSYFMTINNRTNPIDELKEIFKNKILPLLQEYFYGDWGKIMLVIGKAFIEKKVEPVKFLNSDSYEDFEEYEEKPIYSFTNSDNWNIDSFRTIYGQ